MSLSNDNQLLDLVAFAARFPKETRHWDPRIAILDELNDIVTCAESDKGIDPTDELPTKESLDTRLKHLDNSVSRTPLRTLDVKDTCSPSDDLELVKHYLTRLKYEYKKRRKESASAEFRFPENSPESDVKTVGVWIAARVCFELGYAYPGHQRYPLHSIIKSLVEVVRQAPEARGHVPRPGDWPFQLRTIPPPPPPRPAQASFPPSSPPRWGPVSFPTPASSFGGSSASSRCPSPIDQPVFLSDGPSAANGGTAL